MTSNFPSETIALASVWRLDSKEAKRAAGRPARALTAGFREKPGDSRRWLGLRCYPNSTLVKGWMSFS